MKNICKTHQTKKKTTTKRAANDVSPKVTRWEVDPHFPRQRLGENLQTPNPKSKKYNTLNDDTTPAPGSCTLALDYTGASDRIIVTGEECGHSGPPITLDEEEFERLCAMDDDTFDRVILMDTELANGLASNRIFTVIP